MNSTTSPHLNRRRSGRTQQRFSERQVSVASSKGTRSQAILAMLFRQVQEVSELVRFRTPADLQ